MPPRAPARAATPARLTQRSRPRRSRSKSRIPMRKAGRTFARRGGVAPAWRGYVRRWSICLLALIWMFGGVVPSTAAQSLTPAEVRSSIQLGDDQSDAQKAADVAVELSRLEADADYAGLYE